MNFKLDIGAYIVQVVPALDNLWDNEEMPGNNLKINSHEIKVLFISYSDSLVKTYEDHLPPKNNFTISELRRKFQVDKIISN